MDASIAGADPAAVFPFDNSFARLPDRFYARLDPTPVRAPKLLRVNRALAEALGLDWRALESSKGVEILAGNRSPSGAEPLAMAYAGHQFGGWSPQLGDGRAILLGEVVDRAGRRRDIQLKGSGPTPFSRMGDGRAPLGPVLREYIVSEAMAALGVPTTRALAAVTTGEPVIRETPGPGAVLTRVASSHLRVGTFQYFYARDDLDGLRQLADYAIERHDPAAASDDAPYRAFLDGVIERQARLIAQWMGLGFIHGVMNTDNMTISGETIDYGPCAFMDAHHPATVFSSIDQFGRYAYANQPRIGQWNLAQLAQALLPLLGETEEAAVATAQERVDRYPAVFERAWRDVMRAKLGLQTAEDADRALIDGLLTAMADNDADFTLTFRALSSEDGAAARDQFADPSTFDAWAAGWRDRLEREPQTAEARAAAMRAVNPAVIPRNHQVEKAIAAGLVGELGPFEALLDALAAPYDAPPADSAYVKPPALEERVRATFCGT